MSCTAGEHCDPYHGVMGDPITIRPATRADIGPLVDLSAVGGTSAGDFKGFAAVGVGDGVGGTVAVGVGDGVGGTPVMVMRPLV